MAARTRVHEVFVSLLQRGFAGKVGSALSACVCLLWQTLGTPLPSTPLFDPKSPPAAYLLSLEVQNICFLWKKHLEDVLGHLSEGSIGDGKVVRTRSWRGPE